MGSIQAIRELTQQMANQVVEIIRQQWQKRHHENPQVRQTANHMITTHILLLRKLREGDWD